MFGNGWYEGNLTELGQPDAISVVGVFLDQREIVLDAHEPARVAGQKDNGQCPEHRIGRAPFEPEFTEIRARQERTRSGQACGSRRLRAHPRVASAALFRLAGSRLWESRRRVSKQAPSESSELTNPLAGARPREACARVWMLRPRPRSLVRCHL